MLLLSVGSIGMIVIMGSIVVNAQGFNLCQRGNVTCDLGGIELTADANFESVPHRKRARIADVLQPVQDLGAASFGRWYSVSPSEADECSSSVWHANILTKNRDAPWVMLQFRQLNLTEDEVLYIYSSALLTVPLCNTSSASSNTPLPITTHLPLGLPKAFCFPTCTTADSPYCQRLTAADIMAVGQSSSYTTQPLMGGEVVLQYERRSSSDCEPPDVPLSVSVLESAEDVTWDNDPSNSPAIQLRALMQGKQGFMSSRVVANAEKDAGGLVQSTVTSNNSTQQTSGNCNIDVACYQAWANVQAKGVVMLVTARGGACTGALINNPGRKLLILTAAHCVPNTTAVDRELANWVAVFNYGLTVMFRDGASDVAVLQLQSDALPRQVEPAWLGWSTDVIAVERSNSGSGQNATTIPVGLNGMTVVHQPGGDVTKIAISSFSPRLGSYPWPGRVGQPGVTTHWEVQNYTRGSTEDGSSGAPLFDTTSRVIVGVLSGGSALCGNSLEDFYGSLRVAWTRGLWQVLGGDRPNVYASMPSYSAGP